MPYFNTPYKYSALPPDGRWTRTLALHPGSQSDDIAVTLWDEDIDNSSEYEALSYVWGSVESLEEITVDGTNKLRVTHDLAVALRYLRYTSQGRVLWVDSICINQADLAERSRQVAHMHLIYRQAKAVQVWIGPEADDSELAVQQLQEIGSKQQVVRADNNSWIMVPRDSTAYARMLSNERAMLELPKRTWNALFAFFNRPWFERVWIRQEIHPANRAFFHFMDLRAPARESATPNDIRDIVEPSDGEPGVARIMCGASTLSWWTLRNVVTCFQRKTVYDNLGPVDLPIVWQLRERLSILQALVQLRLYSWANLLRDQRYTKCTDERDRVFATIGMMEEPDNALPVTPDYTKPIVDVFRDITLTHINFSKSLDILQHCFTIEMTPSNHPSWIPDWTAGNWPVLGCNDPRVWFQASSHLYCDVELVGHHTIGALGVIIDGVETLLSDFPVTVQHAVSSIVNHLEIRSLQDAYPGGGSNLSALLSSFTFRYFYESTDPPSGVDMKREWGERILEMLVSAGPMHENPNLMDRATAIDMDEISRFGQEIMPKLSNHTIFRTSKRYFGMAPRWTKPGDVIAVLVGAPIPFVLRRTDDPEPRLEHSVPKYRIVAPCYLHGFMDGEALLGAFPPNWSTLFSFRASRRVFRKDPTDWKQYADPRIFSSFPQDRLSEYWATIDVAMKSRHAYPKLRVERKDLEDLGRPVEVLYLV